MPDAERRAADRRPLTARSVIATTLLGAAVPQVRAAQLVRVGAVFGIAEGAMRTALWRMASDGELEGEDGWYRLAGGLLERRRRIDDSQAAERRSWDGTWEVVVVTADRRPAAQRLALRAAATALRLGEVREGTWARPDNLSAARLPGSRAVLDAQCARFTGAVGVGASAGGAAGLAARLFDLDGWARRAGELLAALDAGAERPEEGDAGPAALAEGFLLSVDVVRHLQVDPLLPDELLPAGWPGARLRERYAEHDRAYTRRFRRWLDADA